MASLKRKLELMDNENKRLKSDVSINIAYQNYTFYKQILQFLAGC